MFPQSLRACMKYDILYYGIGGPRGVVYPLAVPPVYVVWGCRGAQGVGRGAVDIPGRRRMDIFIASCIILNSW